MADVTVVDVRAQKVLGMCRRGRYRQMSDMIPTIFQFAQEKGAKIVGRPIFVCHEAAGPSYEKLFAWLKENGREITGPTREVYVSDPRTTPPDQLITEIYAPLD